MMLNKEEVRKFITDENAYGSMSLLGYDLTVKSIKQIIGNVGMILREETLINEKTYTPVKLIFTNTFQKQIFKLSPGIYSVTYDQGLSLPMNVNGVIRNRSSLLRIGAEITNGFYEPGFHVDNVGSIMIVHLTIVLEQHARIAQVLMYTNSEVKQGYTGQYQGEKDFK